MRLENGRRTDLADQVFSYGALAQSDSQRIQTICNMDADLTTSQQYYDTIVAEWSTAITDCAPWLGGVGSRSVYGYGTNNQRPIGSCAGLTGNAAGFSSAYIQRLRRYYEVQARVFSKHTAGQMFWSWKIEPGTADEFSYSQGMKYGYVPSTSPLDFKYPESVRYGGHGADARSPCTSAAKGALIRSTKAPSTTRKATRTTSKKATKKTSSKRTSTKRHTTSTKHRTTSTKHHAKTSSSSKRPTKPTSRQSSHKARDL